MSQNLDEADQRHQHPSVSDVGDANAPPAVTTGPEPAVTENSNDAPATSSDGGPAVRFSSAVDVAPNPPAVTASHEHDNDGHEGGGNHTFSDVAADQLKAFTKSLHGQPLQTKRMNTSYQFEAFSLPASRVPSREDDSHNSTRLPTPSSTHRQSPHGSPRITALTSPPLTPSGSHGTEQKQDKDAAERYPGTEIPTITPEPSSSSHERHVSGDQKVLAHRPRSAGGEIRRAASAEHAQQGEGEPSHRRGMFQVGPGSVPASRESSPSRSSASNFYSKPATPYGDANDPYAKGKRPAQQGFNRQSIDPRFVFSRKKKPSSPGSSKTNLSDKRNSGIFGGAHDSTGGDSGGLGHHPHGSMADLKRFFRKGGSNKKRESSPAPSGTRTPPASRSNHQLPFDESHDLASKYGKLGKVLGSGAGGSVRLMKRKEDGTVFAVKEFRARHPYESEKEYTKKVTAEFCVGSTLHHGNIIETLDILQEKGRWFEVMEYAPFDMFAIVMTGKMSREEISCCFLQILNGVTYLHSVGLAHRDLKLDNVVVSDKGIMKIIDFGSAHVFKYPFESEVVPAKGIVGSDPYLAPEVYDSKEYDAAAVDIWSLAIIFCCMTLRRFPWKIPKMTDNSFKLFAAEPTPGHDPNKLVVRAKSESDLSHTRAREFLTGEEGKEKEKEKLPHSQRHQQQQQSEPKEEGTSGSAKTSADKPSTDRPAGDKKETIRGPWRILRLLPRESRHIIHRMLDLNPKTRATMEDILAEAWVADTVICQQFDDGTVVPAEDHTHVLEPHSSQAQQKA